MTEDKDLVSLTVEVVRAFVGQNNMRAEEVPAFIAATHAALSALTSPAPMPVQIETAPAKPRVSIRKSLASKDHIISMLDGKPYKTLRRHLSNNGVTPEEYRARFNLPADYPLVAESYSAHRRALAKAIGLGGKSRPGRGPAASKSKTPTTAARRTGSKAAK